MLTNLNLSVRFRTQESVLNLGVFCPWKPTVFPFAVSYIVSLHTMQFKRPISGLLSSFNDILRALARDHFPFAFSLDHFNGSPIK
jgi:hypothetical protein